MSKYFKIEDNLADIIERYPETLDAFVSIGFSNLADEKKRKVLGKSISLKMALQMKSIDEADFTEQLIRKIEAQQVGNGDKINVQGILPCPVRIPLMEGFEAWMDEHKMANVIEHKLQAASMGVDWLVDDIKESESADVLSDLFISAGFDLFFDEHLIGKYKSQNVFKDITDYEHFNKDFENDKISLKDPDGHYSIIGVVPAVFLVNQDELGDREMPRSWEDLLKPEFENTVSLPIGDFDMFNAILLNIHKKYGDEGIKKLGKCLMKSMHPSEMVKSHMKAEKPIVTIMPYFFTKMTKRGGPMVAVWPADGAIISPIFMLSKREKEEELKPLVDFFAGKEVGELLSHNGKFPSTNPQVDNMISKEQEYMWIGWDYIKENNIGALIGHCEKIFNDTVNL